MGLDLYMHSMAFDGTWGYMVLEAYHEYRESHTKYKHNLKYAICSSSIDLGNLSAQAPFISQGKGPFLLFFLYTTR
jgi:hypothetical protein